MASFASAPVLLGTNTVGTAATQQVTTGTAALAGAVISVHIGQSSGSGETVTDVSDSAGNQYDPITSQSSPQPAYLYQTDPSVSLPLPSGGIITVTFSGGSSTKLVAVSAVAGAAGLDGVAPNGGTSTTPTVSSPSGLIAVPELALATFCSANAGGAPTLAAGWTSLELLHSGSSPYLQVAWKLTSGQGAITASETIVSANWGALIATLTPLTYSPPLVPVFPAGFGPLPADFNGWIQQPFAFLTNQVVLRAEQHATQTLSGFTTITYDTILEDPYAAWDSVTSRWTAPFTGWYEITLNHSISTASVITEAVADVSGNVQWIPGSLTCVSQTEGGTGASVIVALTGGDDYISGQAWTSSSVSLDVSSAGRCPWLEVSFISQ